jgi:hypothetical protein
MLAWEALAIWTGAVNFYVPFYGYGYTVASSLGLTEDLSAPAWASFLCNFFCHHVQMFFTMRNWTAWMSFIAVTSVL